MLGGPSRVRPPCLGLFGQLEAPAVDLRPGPMPRRRIADVEINPDAHLITSPVAASDCGRPDVHSLGAGHDTESREPFRDRPVVRKSDIVWACSSQRAESCY